MTNLGLVEGERVKFDVPTGEARNWWVVRAVSERFVILTRQARFKAKGVLAYTIIDWERGVRGPCNLIGQGWGDGTYSESECAELLAALQRERADVGETQWLPKVEVSYRNNVPISLTHIRGVRKKLQPTPASQWYLTEAYDGKVTVWNGNERTEIL